jgi:hypothetical protein
MSSIGALQLAFVRFYFLDHPAIHRLVPNGLSPATHPARRSAKRSQLLGQLLPLHRNGSKICGSPRLPGPSIHDQSSWLRPCLYTPKSDLNNLYPTTPERLPRKAPEGSNSHSEFYSVAKYPGRARPYYLSRSKRPRGRLRGPDDLWHRRRRLLRTSGSVGPAV